MRVGIVGTSWGRTHVGTVRACGSEVAVIVGRDPEKTRRVAQEERIALGTTDLGALEDVDVVVIASPTSSHAALLRRFAHKPVICEKPLLPAAPTADDAERVRMAPLLVNYAFPFLHGARQLAQLIRAGELGTVECVELRVGVSLHESAGPEHWLLDVGSHPVAWLSTVFGPFGRVSYRPGSAGTATAALVREGMSLDVALGPAAQPGIEYAIAIHGSRREGTLDGTYRIGRPWSFHAALDGESLGPGETSPHEDPWYAANCRSVAAAISAFAGGPRAELIDGAAALALEAALWPTRS